MGKMGRIKGPGGSNEGPDDKGHGGREPLTPDRPYEPTGSFPENPRKVGRALFTRAIKGPSWRSANEGPTEPAYQPGPTRRHKRET